MPTWKKNLIIAGIILLFIYIPGTMFGLLGHLWHSILTLLASAKKTNGWH